MHNSPKKHLQFGKQNNLSHMPKVNLKLKLGKIPTLKHNSNLSPAVLVKYLQKAFEKRATTKKTLARRALSPKVRQYEKLMTDRNKNVESDRTLPPSTPIYEEWKTEDKQMLMKLDYKVREAKASKFRCFVSPRLLRNKLT